jgi:hypothetical protein
MSAILQFTEKHAPWTEEICDPAFRRALAYQLVWGCSDQSRTGIERRLVGVFEEIAKDIQK